MKKHLLFYLVFVLLAIGGRAQNTTVTLGTDITASNLTGPLIINGGGPSFGVISRHVALYTAAEIKATPFAGRAITKIAWYKDDTARFVGTANSFITIYLKQTTATNLSGPLGVNWPTELTGATQVYTMTAPVISTGTGWKEFVLPVPFMWNGTSNLEVLVDCFGQGNAYQNAQWRYSGVTGTKSAINYGPSPMLPGSSNRPNMQLTFSVFNNDAGITAITSPPAQVAPNVITPVQVSLENFGFNAITTATIGWKINNVSQPDYTWSGSLNAGQNITGVTIGNQGFPVGSHTIKVYPKTVNGVADGFVFNDTATFQVVACNALSGNYTINKNAPASANNFTSFTAVSQLLNACGISGPVTITVVPGSGPYNESINLVNIPGTSATNTITFEGNGNTVTAANTAVVFLDRANYVKFNNLMISQTSTATLCYGVQLIGSSDFTTISNCTINMLTANANSNAIGILLGSGSNSNTAGNYSSNSLFQNNIFNGGYYAIRINGLAVTGSTPIGAVNNRIIGNQFRDYYSNGIYMTNADGTKIEGNDFSRPTRTDVSSFSGVYISSGSVNILVNKNRFHNTHGAATSLTGGVTPITVDAAAAAGSENIIRNNLFYDLNNAGVITGISLFSSTTGVHIYHNTFSFESQVRPASNTSAIKVLNMSGAGNNVKFVNNIVTMNLPGTANKHGVYLGAATTSFVSNNNVFYLAPAMTNAQIGYLASNRTTLTDWQAANTTTPYDVNSVTFNPAYTSIATGNLKPTSPDVNNKGQASPVTDDILGVTRNSTTPDPGAYEFDLGSLDAGITAITSPTTPLVPGNSPVTVNLKNFGTANLTATTIGWKVNGVIQPSYTWAGTLAGNQTASATIGNYTFSNGTYTICAWTKNPNAGTDVNVTNDSTCTTINVCMPLAGNYTIDKNTPTSATNFQSFTAAATVLHNCGVSGKVTFNVVTGSGPYTDQVELLDIPGVTATNRVIFNGNGNTLSATPNAQKTTILKLNNADYVKINNLNVILNGTGGVGNPTFVAIQLVNNSDNDTISNCTITMPHTAGSNADILGILAGTNITSPGNNTNNSVFLNNTIKGGVYGIRINGNADGTGAVNNRIIGNSVQDGNTYGIYLDNNDGGLVEQNEIKRPTLQTPNSIYAISLNGISKNNKISKNRILNLWGGQTTNLGSSYGIHSAGAGAPAGSENLVSNNVIYDTNTPQTCYGIYNNGNSGINYFHNTIVINNPGTANGFYQTQPAAGIKFNNNIVTINAAGSADKFALYFATASSTIESNNNDLYFDPSNTGAFVGYFGGNFATLANWKTANSNAFDQQSVFVNPGFKDPVTGNFTPVFSALNNIGKPLPVVPTDITGAVRSTTTPDPGAYEFTPVLNDVGVIAFVSPNSGCGLSNQETVTITIRNFGSTTHTSIPVNYQVDGGAFVTGTYTGSLPFGATANYTFATKANLSIQGPHTIVAKTLLPGEEIPANDTKTVTVNNATQAVLPFALDFEMPATGINSMRTVTRTNSNIAEGAGASFGTGTKGIIMDGVDQTNWLTPTGVTDPWTNNLDNYSAAFLCVSTAGGTATDSVWLTFDMKQLFKTSNANTNFRITVNGTQVGATYRPPFSGTPINWQKVKVDLTPYKSLPAIQIGLESNVKEAYANGTGTANLIDNIQVKRRIISGVKSDVLQSQIHVFPNPGNGKFNLSLPTGRKYKLEITDMTGKLIKQETIFSENSQFDLGGAKGIYLLKLSNAQECAIRKLIIE